MSSIRILGMAVVFGGTVLLAMALLAANAPADQIGDPFVGDLTKHTIRYLIIAAASVCGGGMVAVFGPPLPGTRATR